MNSRGFTLPEILTALAIISTLLICAAPTHAQLQRYRLQADAATFTVALRHTRTQAIISGTGMTMQAIGSDWSQGWVIFSDANRNAQMDATDRLLLSRTLSGRSTIKGNQPISSYVHFTATGEPVQTGGSFQAGAVFICHNDSPESIKVVLGKSGRIRTEAQAAEQPCN